MKNTPASRERSQTSDLVRVLVADDDDHVLKAVSLELRDSGHECETAVDGAEALGLLRSHRFDVALIDLDMPKIDGFQVLAAIQTEALPVVPIVLTGVSSVAETVKAMKLGSFDFLQKPLDRQLLQQAIRRALEFRRAQIEVQRMKVLVEQWKSTFNASPSPAMAIDLDGRIARCNQTAANLVAKSPDELIGLNCHEALCLGRHPAPMCPFTRGAVEDNMPPVEMELWDGIYEVSSAPLQDAGGRPWGRFSVAYDLTERKRAEQALSESEETFRTITGAAQDAIIMMDGREQISFFNPAAESIFGWTAEEVIGRNMHELLAPEQYRAAYVKALRHFRKTGEGPVLGKTLELTALRKDGSEFPMEISVSAVHLRDAWHAVGIIRDISDRKRTEVALRESTRRFLDVLYASNDAILLIGNEKFVDCNEATARMLGYSSRDQFLMTHPSELSPTTQPDGRGSFEKANEMMQTAFDKGYHRFEWIHRRANGEDFPVEVSLTPISYQGKTVLHCLWRDMTAFKQAEALLQRAHAELEMRVEERTAELAEANASLQFEVAERVRAEEGLRQVNRMLRVLSECNQAMVRLSDETELLQRACRILVEFGGYPLAWIGILKKGDDCVVLPVACWGFDDGLMPPIAVEELGSEPRSGIVGEAIRTGKPCISPDLRDNRDLHRWQEEALRRDGVLHAAIPLSFSEGDVTGILGVSGLESDSFAGMEMDLLRELAADLDYAVAALRTRSEYRATQEQIARLSSLKEQLLGTLGLTEKLKLITDAAVTIFGADFARVWMVGEGDLCDKGCVHAAAVEGPHVCRDRTRCLHLLASSGRYTHMNGPHQRVPIGCYKIGRIASGDEPAFITNDVVHDPRVHNREWAAELGLVSFAGWRLLSPEGTPVGVLALFSQHPITKEQGHLLEDLGNTASHVILTGLATDALREVEQRRLIEEELRKAHNEVERLLASMSSFLIGVGQDLRISRWNAAAETTFGIRSEDAVGRCIDQCGIRWDWETIVSHMPDWPTIAETVRLPDVRYTRTDGTEGVLGVTLNPVKNDSGAYEGCFFLGVDTTARRNLESQLVQAQKLEAVGRLAAGIAHEINTPTQYVGDNIEFLQIAYDSLLGSVKTLPAMLQACRKGAVPAELLSEAEALIDAANLDYLAEQVPRAIEQSIEGIGRITTIVQAMKEFSHPGIAEKTGANINQCIRSTVTVSRNEWKYVADLELDLEDGLPQVSCLPGEINQVFLNMIVNAAHAIGDVVGSEGASGKGTITIRTRRDGNWCEIQISDTGAGIPEDIRERIFDPFFTTKDVGRGTGQGLAIARNVVLDKHGGTITVDSKVGQGTTFTIRLPIGG